MKFILRITLALALLFVKTNLFAAAREARIDFVNNSVSSYVIQYRGEDSGRWVQTPGFIPACPKYGDSPVVRAKGESAGIMTGFSGALEILDSKSGKKICTFSITNPYVGSTHWSGGCKSVYYGTDFYRSVNVLVVRIG